MERGGAEGLKHQAKVRSCGATRHCHQQGNIGVAQKTGECKCPSQGAQRQTSLGGTELPDDQYTCCQMYRCIM